jgi:hypothetical protein
MTTSTQVVTGAPVRSRAASATLWLLAGAVVLMLLLQLVVGGLMPPIGLIQAVVLAVPLVMVRARVRGGYITAVVLIALLLLASVGPIVDDLSTPGRLASFLWTLVTVPELIATAAAAVLAAVAQHRSRSRSMDR